MAVMLTPTSHPSAFAASFAWAYLHLADEATELDDTHRMTNQVIAAGVLGNVPPPVASAVLETLGSRESEITAAMGVA